MIVVDASVWISGVLPSDVFHARSRAWLDGQVFGDGPLGAPTLVLAELGGAISRRGGNVRAAEIAVDRLERTPNLRLVAMDTGLVRHAARLAAELGLRGADAIYVATAARLECPVVTWDDEMFRKGRGVVDARQPAT